MENDTKWLIGLAVGFFTSHTGVLIMAFRSLSGKISKGNGDLHDRVDDVKEKYVRRDDLDGHIQRLDASMQDLQQQLRAQSQQSREQNDKVLAAIASSR